MKKQYQVMLDPACHHLLKRAAGFLGVTMNKALREILTEWMESTDLEKLKKDFLKHLDSGTNEK